MPKVSQLPSTARLARREEAFQALDALGVERVRGQPPGRVAAMAATSINYVNAWVEARGYGRLLLRRRRRDAHQKG